METVIVIFGGSGDLTSRKLIPALYSNYLKGRLPRPARIIGVSRTPIGNDAFREKLAAAVRASGPAPFDEAAWNEFASCISYTSGDIEVPGTYQALARAVSPGGAPVQCMYYLATAPRFYRDVIGRLAEAGMMTEEEGGPYRRIIVEKPFGRDLASAHGLNEELHRLLQETQIFRIDHYLGKETVQNVLMLRFGNAIFEPIWNRNHIDHVQITVAETVGVGHRAGYYEGAGALRDMFQNHLLQLMTLVAMEPPAVVDADSLRNEKVKILTALREIPPEHSKRFTVRGQYRGYTAAEGVDPRSTTETYAALQAYVDNWRWQGVPFYLRSGKCLPEKSSEIIVQFRRPPTQIFDVQAGVTELFTNHLSICIQPDEGMHLRFITKVPDQGMHIRPVDMEFHYRDSFGDGPIPEAYERLLLDALQGDASLFTRGDEIELAWKFIDGVREGWEGGDGAPLETYEPGSWGPEGAETLLARERRWWKHDCTQHPGVRAAQEET
ncbi:MAG TPA: glucose-6-phosphate dehydrogenase [Bacteroidota bacterium]|nr:glucose-6-phosphate dehydrogenase [Bacteroidota bacterium]